MKLLVWVLLPLAASAVKCPQLSLTWGAYNADPSLLTSVCKYSNVRFASPPVGELRFAAPEYPPKPNLPPAVAHPGCYAMDETPCSAGTPPDGNNCYPPNFSTQTEDCLFLDIYVPKDALSQSKPVPIVTWFYGGAYVFGSKTQYEFSKLPFYDAKGLVDASDEPVIVVTSNYRLGAFGWLAGSYMETNAQPNAGLLDQRAALQFVADEIHQVNGDKDRVTAWGESAGASSLLHHLIMPKNIQQPLFSQVFLQSPAYQFLWNRTGVLNDTFNNFTALTMMYGNTTCDDAPINCIRQADVTALAQANQALFEEMACTGILPVGPAVDGHLVPDIPTNLLLSNSPNTMVALESLIVSHVQLEVPIKPDLSDFSFIPQPIREEPMNETRFEQFLCDFLEGDAYADTRAAIAQRYPSAKYAGNQVMRAQHTIMDSSFLCNTRILLDAAMKRGTRAWAMDYAFGADAATHATDLVPTFIGPDNHFFNFMVCSLGLKNGSEAALAMNVLGPAYQSYLVSHAVHGDPNTGARHQAADHSWATAATVTATTATSGAPPTYVTNVMQPAAALKPLTNNAVLDPQTGSDVCGFWVQVAANITKAYNSHSSDSGNGFGEGGSRQLAGDQVVFGGVRQEL